MRLDKFLKVSRIIKRRAVAKEVGDKGLILVNSKQAKPSSNVNEGDILEIRIKNTIYRYRIEKIFEHATEEKALSMYTLLEEKSL